MVLDTTMPRDQFDQVQRFARDFAERFDVDSGDARIGVLSYGSSPRTQFNLNRYKTRSSIVYGINRIRSTGGTPDTAAALRTARTSMFTAPSGDRPLANNVLLLVTSKRSRDQQDTQDEARRLRDAGANVYVIGLDLPDTDEIESIASPPGPDNSFNLRSPADWNRAPNNLVDRIVQRKS